jgi:hypothetical protein
MSLTVRELVLGRVSFKTKPFSGIITQECLKRLGWSFDRGNGTVSEVPDRLWRTLVADRDENGKNAPLLYQFACREAIEQSGDCINIDGLLNRKNTVGGFDNMQQYLNRVKSVNYGRLFIEVQSSHGYDQFVGLGPWHMEVGDIAVILFGCSVPVVLRPRETADCTTEYEFIGEAYVYGNMDGEVLAGES